MQRIQTEQIIHAPVAKVWEALMDFTAYPEWNPFITSLSGEARVGAHLHASIQPPGQQAMVLTPKVLVCEPEREFRWLGKLWFKGLFDGEHYFQLEAIGEGQTRLIQGENFSGLLARLLLKMIGTSTREGFVAMNEAMKARVE